LAVAGPVALLLAVTTAFPVVTLYSARLLQPAAATEVAVLLRLRTEPMVVPVAAVVEQVPELLLVEVETLQAHPLPKVTMVDQAPERLITAVAVAVAQLAQALAEPLQLAATAALVLPHLFPAPLQRMQAAVVAALIKEAPLARVALAAVRTAQLAILLQLTHLLILAAAVAVAVINRPALKVGTAAPASSSSSTHWVLLRS
jgi:hypothetical protein